MGRYTEADIRRVVGAKALDRGWDYFLRGKVKEFNASPDGQRIEASVVGSGSAVYRQNIRIRTAGATTELLGSCTCAVGFDCKHVAAVLLKGLQLLPASASVPATGQPAAGKPQVAGGPPAGPFAAHAPGAPTAGFAPSYELKHWLEGLAKPLAGDPDAFPDDVTHRLVYVLAPESPHRAYSWSPTAVKLYSVRLLKGGGYGKGAKEYDPGNAFNGQTPGYLRPIDLEILRDFYAAARTRLYGDPYRLDRLPGGTRVLEAMLGTGRCRLGGLDGPLLGLGPLRRGSLVWQRDADGRQRLTAQLAGDAEEAVAGAVVRVLPLAPPYYIDADAGLCGPLDLGLPAEMAARLLAAPAVAPREAPLVVEALRRSLAGHGLADAVPLPAAPSHIEHRQVVPQPVLRLIRGDLQYDALQFDQSSRWRYNWQRQLEPVKVPLARLSFDYGGREVAAHDRTDPLERTEGEQLVIMRRDQRAEKAVHGLIAELGFSPVDADELFAKSERHGHDYFLLPTDEEIGYGHNVSAATLFSLNRFIAFSLEIVPWLREEHGFRVEVADDYPVKLAEGEAEWWADVGEGSGIDWFSFALGIEFEGERLSLLPMLTRLIADIPQMVLELEPDERSNLLEQMIGLADLWHPLPDGRLLRLPGERLLPIVKALLELAGPRRRELELEDGKLRLSPLDAADLAAFTEESEEARLMWRGHERLLQLGEKLRAIEHLPQVAPPAHLAAILRPYQREGLNWLSFLRETGFGGALADDMGLGKTVQALAFLSLEKQAGRLDRPALILSPTSVLPNWKREAEKFAPELSVLVLHGPERARRFAGIDTHDLVLSTYPLLVRDKDELLAHDYHVAILDEAQAIKNPKSAVATTAHQLKAGTRLALTGTPLENNLDEVWSLFRFLNPGVLGDQATFRRLFRTPIEKHGDAAAQKFLSRRLKPFLLRRSKDQVALELPPKTEILDYIELEGGQRDLYETIRLMMDDKVRKAISAKGIERSRIVVLDALLKLRQVCCDPRLVKLEAAKKVKRSAKLDRLMELLPELIEEGRRVLLFSQFTSMLGLIEAELAKHKIRYVKITGDTRDRDKPVRDFQAGRAPLFLISLKAGGTGLNLTAADTVIHYDPWWNPAVEAQATDRAHRIGQDKPVFVHKLIVKDGVEEAIQQLKQKKAELAAALFDEAASGRFALSEDDLAALLAPLAA